MNQVLNILNQWGDFWGQWVGHAAWQAGLVGLFALGIYRWKSEWASPVLYSILLLGLLKFAVPPLMSMPTGIFSYIQITEKESPPDSSVNVSEKSRESSLIFSSDTIPVQDRSSVQGSHPVDISAVNAVTPGHVSKVKSQHSAVSLTPWAILMLIHLLGGLLVGLVLVVRTYRLNRYTRSLDNAADLLQQLINDTSHEMGLSRVPLLKVSECKSYPFTFGLFKPVIVMSKQQVEELSEEELRVVLLHELAHHRRYDLWVNVFQMVMRVIWWFHPVVYFLNKEIRKTREDCCDDLLLSSQMVTDESYCATLLRVIKKGEPLGNRRSSLAISMADGEHPLGERLRRIMNPSQVRSNRLSRKAVMLLLILALIVLPGLQNNVSPVLAEGESQGVNSGDVEQKQESGIESESNKEPAEELPEPITYTGKVVDRISGKPIPNATVEVKRTLSRDPRTNKKTYLQTTKHQSDGQGVYSFTLPPEEVSESSLYLEVNAHHPEYQSKGDSGYSHTMILKNLENGEPPFYETIELSAGEQITAVVLQPDGTPAVNTQVLTYSKPPSKEPLRDYLRGAFQHTQTDEQGRFSMVIATPGDGVLWVFPKNASPVARRIGDQRGDLGKIRLQDGVRISGQVVDVDGSPVANVAVNMERVSDGKEVDEFLNKNAVSKAIGTGARTDSQGKFQLKPLPPGTYYANVATYVHDQSERLKRPVEELEVEQVFTRMKVTIEEGELPEPLMIRADPHIVVRGRFYDSKGNPRSSHGQNLWGYNKGEPFFSSSSRPGKDGWFEFKVPKGAEKVQVNLITNEHSALRWRTKPEEPLKYGSRIDLGTLSEDFKTLEVVRYTAPLLLLKAVDEDGKQLHDFKPDVKYQTRPAVERKGTFISGALGDVGFENQPDGRWRSSQMLPDEEVSITLEKEGYQCEPQTVSLKESEVRELEVVLKKVN